MLPLCWKLRPSWATLQLHRRWPPTGEGGGGFPAGKPKPPPAGRSRAPGRRSAERPTAPGGRRGAVVTPTAAVFLRESLWPGGRSAPTGAPKRTGATGGPLAPPPTRPLRPVIARNTRPLRLTATAGTKLVGAYFFGRISIPADVRAGGFRRPRGLPNRRLVYDPKAFVLLHPRSRLDQAFAHCPKFLSAARSAEARFNFGVAVRSLKPAGDHRFGGPLPTPTA
jgi:hypothetical protein